MHGESIPIEGRIVAVADVFDALTTRRPYKEPWPLAAVENFLEAGAGKHFDPALIDIFRRRRDEFVEVMQALADPEDSAATAEH